MGCWTCLPFCENCKPKFYDCPECGGRGSIYFKKCTNCGRPMDSEDERRGRDAWLAKRRGNASQTT